MIVWVAVDVQVVWRSLVATQPIKITVIPVTKRIFIR